MEKKELRKKARLIRSSIQNKKEKSLIIEDKIRNHSVYKNAQVVAFYFPLKDEVDVSLLMKEAMKNKTVCLPKVTGETSMEFYAVDESTTLKEGSFHVMEPVSTSKINSDQIDCMIVPGLCFDIRGYRIGYGKGYYDHYLENTCFPTIGVCFKDLVLQHEMIETDEKDKAVSVLISD